MVEDHSCQVKTNAPCTAMSLSDIAQLSNPNRGLSKKKGMTGTQAGWSTCFSARLPPRSNEQDKVDPTRQSYPEPLVKKKRPLGSQIEPASGQWCAPACSILLN